ncbi:MAG: hypothetical protein RIF32_22045, partial [Leptospirales bacterium]
EDRRGSRPHIEPIASRRKKAIGFFFARPVATERTQTARMKAGRGPTALQHGMNHAVMIESQEAAGTTPSPGWTV